MITPLTQGLHHLGFTVSDLDAARDFFTEALQFDLLGEDSKYPAVFLSDDVIVITLWAADSNASAFDMRHQVGLHHAAFHVESLAALQSLYARLKDWPGVELECEVSPPGPESDARHFLLRMPGGPRIEFWVSDAV